MKFLIDAHLPPSLCRALAAEGHDVIHTSDLPDGNATTDEVLRSVAIAEGRVLVTKDRDFFDSRVLHGAPPKLVLVRCGNMRKRELVSLVVGQLDARSSLVWNAAISSRSSRPRKARCRRRTASRKGLGQQRNALTLAHVAAAYVSKVSAMERGE